LADLHIKPRTKRWWINSILKFLNKNLNSHIFCKLSKNLLGTEKYCSLNVNHLELSMLYGIQINPDSRFFVNG